MISDHPSRFYGDRYTIASDWYEDRKFRSQTNSCGSFPHLKSQVPDLYFTVSVILVQICKCWLLDFPLHSLPYFIEIRAKVKNNKRGRGMKKEQRARFTTQQFFHSLSSLHQLSIRTLDSSVGLVLLSCPNRSIIHYQLKYIVNPQTDEDGNASF